MKQRSDLRGAFAGALGILGLVALACLVVSFWWTPEAMAAGVPLQALGVEAQACPGCPLCGMSRAFSAASHLRIDEAIGFNRAILVAYPAAALVAVAAPIALARELLARRRA